MPNKLINEQSPYLLQHAHNPVDWYPWGDEAFERAKKENKPVLVSIGYAACHWCHVMERESFENTQVAAYMNEHFINIKVDREEHPGVDNMYMDAVQAISGSGGWPLNVFVTAERVPFFGGTYYPPRPAYNKPSWIQLLNRMKEIWEKRKDEVTSQADQMVGYLKQVSRIGSENQPTMWDMKTCDALAEALLRQADMKDGGFGQAPKFPGTMAISCLLEHYHFTKHEPSLKHALLSLDAMVAGGIYDQLGGGFARYATDNEWLVPHFEKMLYDNALLITALCDGYAATQSEVYKKIIEETIAFAERELKDKSGGYYSALDADSEGEEGKYYTWTWQQWLDALGENDEVVARYFGVKQKGNWEGTNILHVAESIEAIAQDTGINELEIMQRIEDAKHKLFSKREERVRPATDDKSLLSWNALMNIALSKAGGVLGNEKYIQRAAEHMQWMLQSFEKNDALLHVWKQREARIEANLDDHAYLIQAMLQLAPVTGNNEWILRAAGMIERVVRDFHHEEGSFFYFTSVQQKDIPVRKVDVHDSATPSANTIMAHNLLLAGMCMERTDWLEEAYLMLQKMSITAMRYAYSFSYWGILLQRYAAGQKTIVCTGEHSLHAGRELLKHWVPNGYVITSQKEIFDMPVLEGKQFKTETLIFVCTQDACLAPVANIEEALLLFNQ